MNIINLQRVTAKTTLGRSTLYAYMRDGKFPASIRLGDRHIGWIEEEVDAWVKGRVEASRGTAQKTEARQ
jgi:prophage regulatory protein